MRTAFVVLSVVICLVAKMNGAEAVGFKNEKMVLYQPDEVLRERIPKTEDLANYCKKLEQACSKHFAKETRPESLDIVVAVKPGQQSRVWFISSHSSDDKTRDALRKELESVTPCEVTKGPVAFAIIGKIAGGDGKAATSSGGSEPPMPDEWRKADANSERPLIIPDSILSIIWPDKK